MVNLKVKVTEPTLPGITAGKESELIIHEQIIRVPNSEKLKVLISTDTEVDNIDVFLKSRKENVINLDSSLDGGSKTLHGRIKFNGSDEFKALENDCENDWDHLDIESLSDDDLRMKLQRFKVQVGPIIGSTRKLYQNRLASLLQKRKGWLEYTKNCDVDESREIRNIKKVNTFSVHNQAELDGYHNSLDREHTNLKKAKRVGILMRAVWSVVHFLTDCLKLALLSIFGLFLYYVVYDSD